VTVSRPRAMALFLFEHGMDPNRPNWLRATPLHHFAEHGDVESAALFLDQGADVHARDEEFCSTPLAWAARCGRTNMVEFLLRRGARPTLADDPPWATPLAWPPGEATTPSCSCCGNARHRAPRPRAGRTTTMRKRAT